LLPPFLARIDAIIGCDWPSMARINLFTIKVSLSHYLLCEVLFPCYCYFIFWQYFFFRNAPLTRGLRFFLFFFLGSWIRGSLQEWQSQYGLGSYTLMCRKSKATPVFCFVAISNCQLSMNLQKHKQTESGKGRGCFCSLSGNICIYASIFPFSFLAFTIPRSCQYFASSFFRIRVGSSFRFVCVLNYANQMAHIDVGCNIIAAIQQFNSLSKCNQRFKEGPSLVLPSIQFKESK